MSPDAEFVVVVIATLEHRANSGGSALFGYNAPEDDRSPRIMRVMKILLLVLFAGGMIVLVTL